ncbi:MAG: ATP-dependent Clp protease adapter ClpS [Actinomycetaceae bacterium]|nr:ATP-dependent Clp protease adapter ClpS [Actinomycetaceae bacterium]
MNPTPTKNRRVAAQSAPTTQGHSKWCTVVWDDPINTMAYVTSVFQRHFGYTPEKASALMLEVHETGKAVVAIGLRERMEADAYAMHSYGLKATIEPVRADAS